MALSNQIAAYEDCITLYEKAADDPVGARALFADHSRAAYFRLRMNHARVLLRKESRRIYDRTDPKYDKCEFDSLICQIKEDTEGGVWLYVSRVNNEILEVETLSEIDGD